MKKLEYSIEIDAPATKVWKTMLDPESYKQWVQESWPGSFYEGTWEQGKTIRFIGDNGSGTLARIDELVPNKSMKADHIAVLLPGGIEDTESNEAKGWIGTKENYTFVANGNKTSLFIEIITNPDWQKMFDDGWPVALNKLKQICEAQA
jgi:uncharacterized protein YndB with AHSA1/START domain